MKKLATYSVFLFLVFHCEGLFSAPPPPPGAAPPCWPPPCVPIDGGILFLIAAGAIFGAKKLYNFKKNRQAEAL